ncbi:MAG: GMC oxidoreductase [Myxococcota bacterium]
MSYSDVLIIGSGFGGAVMAARLGAAAQAQLGGRATVRIVDRGDDPSGRLDPRSGGAPLNAEGNRFRQTLDPDYLSRLAEIHSDPEGSARRGAPGFNVLAGMGLGGGSNVYCGVSIRAPSQAFERARGGRRLWPSSWSRAALDPYYARVEARLKVHQLAWTDAQVPHWQLAAKRDLVFAEGCRRIGATAVPLKVATDRDANEGWWSQGQRFQGRQNLSLNYLLDAQQAGVQLDSGVDVQTIAPTSEGYVVQAIDRRGSTPEPLSLECKILIISGGAVRSSALLLRSQAAFTGARALDRGTDQGQPLLGQGLSGNGDYGVAGLIGEELGLAVEGHKGKPISSVCATWLRDDGFLLLPFYAEPLYLALGRISSLQRPEDPRARGRSSTAIATTTGGSREPDWGLAFKRRITQFGARVMTMGCLAFDDGEGRVVLSPAGDPEVRWDATAPETERRWSKALDRMQQIYEALGGEVFLDNYRKDGTVNTSHPLGGCAMAERPEEGIVNPSGECFGNPGLFVVDGSIIPSALCANPSLTIAAVAEAVAERLVAGQGMPSLATRLGL